MTSVSKNNVIVGGGIAGIMSAMLLAKQGHEVTLIENSSHIGGLLGSREHEEFGWFDNGAHILNETGITEIDKLIFEECYSKEWIQHPRVTACVYFKGQKSKSVFVDAKILPESQYQKAFEELMSLPANEGNFSNLDERIKATFGKTFAENIFSPVMQKFTGLPLEELSEDAHLLFGLNRIICGSAEESRHLKKSNHWNDERLAFHDPKEGASSLLNFYPKHGGIGLWTVLIKNELNKLGVRILTNTSINKAILNNGNITDLVLSNKELISCNKLIWSVPVIFLLRAAGLSIKKLEPPSLCKMILIDLVLDQPLQFEEFYLSCYDQNYRTFRITNYFYIQNKPNDAPYYKATIEVIIPPRTDLSKNELTAADIMSELHSMGLVTEKTKLLASWIDKLDNGFPQPTPAFNNANKKLADFACESISNLSLVGRSAGKSFFIKDVLSEVYDLLS